MKGITESGFEYDVDVEKFQDDWEFIDQLSGISDGNLLMAPKFAETVLGAEQKAALAEHCRHDGKVSLRQMVSEVFEIVGASTNGKN
jgi:hypothetical protein